MKFENLCNFKIQQKAKRLQREEEAEIRENQRRQESKGGGTKVDPNGVAPKGGGSVLAAGLVAKKAVEKGMKIHPRVKTSLAPGSKVVTEYLAKAGLSAISSIRLQCLPPAI